MQEIVLEQNDGEELSEIVEDQGVDQRDETGEKDRGRPVDENDQAADGEQAEDDTGHEQGSHR